MKSGHKVTIGWCDPGQVEGEFAVRLMMLAMARRDRLGPMLRVEGSALISRQRNELARAFLDDTDSDWLLILDADEVLDTPTFDKLIAAAHHLERPVVAGLYFAALDRGGLIPMPSPTLFYDYGDGFAAINDYPADSVIEVDAAGTGCLLVHRSVFEAIRAKASEHEGPNWCWFNDGPINGHWVGEDMIFCRRIKEAGFPIHAHTGATLPHRKRFWLTEQHHTVLRSPGDE